MKKRIEYIDVAKGIGILAVIFGHTSFEKPSEIQRFVFSFHMPLFFICSGYFFHQYKVDKEYLIRLSKSLILPYIIAAVTLIIMNIVSDGIAGKNIKPNMIKL